MFVQIYFLGIIAYAKDRLTLRCIVKTHAHRRKSEGKRKLWKTETGPVHKSDGEREINGIRQESETKHGVPYAFASAAGDRPAGQDGRQASRQGGASERQPSTTQCTRSRRDARISYVFALLREEEEFVKS
jgi:hypothetical protein